MRWGRSQCVGVCEAWAAVFWSPGRLSALRCFFKALLTLWPSGCSPLGKLVLSAPSYRSGHGAPSPNEWQGCWEPESPSPPPPAPIFPWGNLMEGSHGHQHPVQEVFF